MAKFSTLALTLATSLSFSSLAAAPIADREANGAAATAIATLARGHLQESLVEVSSILHLPKLGGADQRGSYRASTGTVHSVLNVDIHENELGISRVHMEWPSQTVTITGGHADKPQSMIISFAEGKCPRSHELENALGVAPQVRVGHGTDFGPAERYDRFMIDLGARGRVSVTFAPGEPCHVVIRQYVASDQNDDWDKRFDNDVPWP